MRGMFYEDIQEGDVIKSAGRTITEADVMTFAGLSGDFNQLHTDEEFAEESLYQGRIAHGLLVLAITSGLAARTGFSEGTALALTKVDWKFRQPVYIGDTIYAEFKVKRKRKAVEGEGGFVKFLVEVKKRGGPMVQKGSWTILMKTREENE